MRMTSYRIPTRRRKKNPPRIPTSELLYSDALDRRERLHIMKADAAEENGSVFVGNFVFFKGNLLGWKSTGCSVGSQFWIYIYIYFFFWNVWNYWVYVFFSRAISVMFLFLMASGGVSWSRVWKQRFSFNVCKAIFKTLRGVFKYFLFSPLPGEMIQFDQFFFRWVETTN